MSRFSIIPLLNSLSVKGSEDFNLKIYSHYESIYVGLSDDEIRDSFERLDGSSVLLKHEESDPDYQLGRIRYDEHSKGSFLFDIPQNGGMSRPIRIPYRNFLDIMVGSGSVQSNIKLEANKDSFEYQRERLRKRAREAVL